MWDLINTYFIANLLIGFYFVFFGVWNIYHWTRLVKVLNDHQVPCPYLMLGLGITWQTIAGSMIMFAMLTKLAAASLIPFSILAALLFHPFWRKRGEPRFADIIIFVTNFTVVIGALLLIIGPITQWRDLLS